MSSSSRVKTLGFLVLVVVAVASIGSYAIWNKPVGQNTASLSSTSILQTTALGTGVQTTSTAAASWPPVQWITVGKIQPMNYYLTLLESNGAQPYLGLGEELRRLPSLTNTTAVASITYLALNATNPEVKEAFELMINGGTASQGDFKYYTVPAYNTELQVLYWIASQRQLKRDDTLALAISMSNGFWVTIGDSRVQPQVRKDVVELLDFFRETDALQQAYGYPRLEQLPLEAKIALTWLGGDTGTHGPHAISGPQTKHSSLEVQMDLASYEWDNVNLTTLRQMRDYVKEEGWISSSIDQTVASLEDYFLVNGNSQFHRTDSWDVTVQVNGETVPARNMNNANINFQYYLRNGYAIGVCEDQMTLVSALLRSWGIATLTVSYYWPLGNWYDGHSNTMYYDAASTTWKVYPYQLGIPFYLVRDAYIFLPPVLQNEFVPEGLVIPKEAAVTYPFQNGEVNTKMFAPMYNITGSYLNRYKIGVATTQMKQWTLYKIRPPTDTTTLVKWSYQGSWNVISDGSQDLVNQNGKVVGDLGQPYVDLSNVSYSYLNGSLFFRFGLDGKIPSHVTAHVTSIWYQVLLDSDSDSSTGYHSSSRNFTPDYMLEFYVSYDPSTNTVSASSDLLKHCGGSSDWCWIPVGFTQHFARTPLIRGGIGVDSFVLTCDYQDISAASGSTIQFFARSGIMYDSQVYNDPAPDDGTVRVTLH